MADYVRLLRALGVKVGLCEIQGRRPSQEDNLQVGIREIKDFPLLSSVDQNEVFTQTFAQLQKQYGQVRQTGSTCCSVTAWIDPQTSILQVATASAGDSTAFLIIIDEALESVVQAKRLNELHNPDPHINYSEYERVAKIDVPTRYENSGPLRLNGQLAVTRGFGDKQFEKFGLLHTPEVFATHKTLSPTQKAFIVLACDGLTEERVVINNRGQHVQKAALSVDGIANIVNTMRKKRPLDQIAEHLVDSAYVNGSHDNISAAVFEVSATPTSAVICDGHNGLISEAIGENFYPVLQHNINERLLINSKPKVVEDIVNKTRRHLDFVTTEIVTEIFKSRALRQIFTRKNDFDDKLTPKALMKLIVSGHTDTVAAFLEKYKKSPVWKAAGSKKLASLIIQYGYTKSVLKTIQHPDPVQAINKTRILFKDPDIRHQLEKGHGYWGWLMVKLGWTKGQRLVKFFDSKHKAIKRITELEVARRTANKK
jgi:serine/threonine protein phosphatase PrpC